MPQRIYFDESGFTGNNLLNPNQTMFSYGSVATCDDEARDFVEYLIKKYGVQNGELKGGKLIASKPRERERKKPTDATRRDKRRRRRV